ncbi:hypothetical protein F5Y11DRAFT_263727 [Daldinia sp. FL1419]|nr:hypothetical protein F5Y11DRAFT_263727 [Daldinia sp. FL1419]
MSTPGEKAESEDYKDDNYEDDDDDWETVDGDSEDDDTEGEDTENNNNEDDDEEEEEEEDDDSSDSEDDTPPAPAPVVQPPLPLYDRRGIPTRREVRVQVQDCLALIHSLCNKLANPDTEPNELTLPTHHPHPVCRLLRTTKDCYVVMYILALDREDPVLRPSDIRSWEDMEKVAREHGVNSPRGVARAAYGRFAVGFLRVWVDHPVPNIRSGVDLRAWGVRDVDFWNAVQWVSWDYGLTH